MLGFESRYCSTDLVLQIDKVHLQDYIVTIMNMPVAERQRVSVSGVLRS